MDFGHDNVIFTKTHWIMNIALRSTRLQERLRDRHIGRWWYYTCGRVPLCDVGNSRLLANIKPRCLVSITRARAHCGCAANSPTILCITMHTRYYDVIVQHRTRRWNGNNTILYSTICVRLSAREKNQFPSYRMMRRRRLRRYGSGPRHFANNVYICISYRRMCSHQG